MGKKLDDIYTKVFKKKSQPKKNSRHETFLINRGEELKQRISKISEFNQSKEIPECTFSPTINKSITSKSLGRMTSPPQVFLNLYQVAEKRKEKSLDSHRRAKQKQIESESKECTFKPDFTKTIKNTNKLCSKNNKYLTFTNYNSEANTKRI